MILAFSYGRTPEHFSWKDSSQTGLDSGHLDKIIISGRLSLGMQECLKFATTVIGFMLPSVTVFCLKTRYGLPKINQLYLDSILLYFGFFFEAFKVQVKMLSGPSEMLEQRRLNISY
jgi:hypothetical protein